MFYRYSYPYQKSSSTNGRYSYSIRFLPFALPKGMITGYVYYITTVPAVLSIFVHLHQPNVSYIFYFRPFNVIPCLFAFPFPMALRTFALCNFRAEKLLHHGETPHS
jgi:hypothetical protein